MTIRPHWYQTAAVSATFEYFNTGKRNPLIGLPTGTGKSVCLAMMVHQILTQWPTQRVLMLTHVSTLISQNCARLLEYWPCAPVGIYSAGLKQRDIAQPIVFAGIQSIYKKIALFGWRDVLFVDEAHLIGVAENAMYLRAIDDLRKINPNMVVIGLTATLYRMGLGDLTNGSIFDGISYDMTDMQGFNRLVAEGFLAPLYAKPTVNEYDVRKVGLVGGEFNKKQLEGATDVREPTLRILEELVHFGQDRHKWIVFANGVNHAEHISEYLNQYFKIPTVAIHSKISNEVRKERLQMYENDTMRCVVNNNVLTVGYDHKPIDYIGMLRHTMSTGLHVQMAGRGTRVSPETGKTDCLYMDFAGNVRRLGPINDPVRPKLKGKSTGDAPVRICDACGVYNHASARVCFACGHEFALREKLYASARTDEVLRTDEPIIETFGVTRVLYARHVSKKEGAAPCIRVTYICGIRPFTEYILLDAPGGIGHESRDWWRLRMKIEPPTPKTCAPYASATDAALTCTSQFRMPKNIRVHTNRPYPKIQSVEF